ncbi:MAG: thioredoxin-dependent thiol peroxidase [Turicibacter sp.]|nr:thioredoxin-dependent thiol peroxidase [Turicibacter sp.]
MLKAGDKAPLDIQLDATDGECYSLRSFEGGKLIVYFYPKDNTPGCTAECINISAVYHEFEKRGFKIIGVSPDSVASHQKFIQKHNLKTLLLADPDHALAEAFGAWGLKKTFGKEYVGLIRSTFILDETGTIIKVIDKVKTKSHGEDLLNLLEEILK